jgi:hypothetical protein
MDSLETATGVSTAVMNYTNYEVNVVIKYKVKLVGWPHEKLVSPYNINTVDELRNVRDALRCGSCFWKGLSSREVGQYVKELEQRTAAGEVIGKKRKGRSDKGTKRGAKKKPATMEDNSDEESAGEGPSKRQKVSTRSKGRGKENRKSGKSRQVGTKSAKSQVPPSQEIITNTDFDTDD